MHTKRILTLCLLIAGALVQTSAFADPGQKEESLVVTLNDENFNDFIKNSKLPVLVDFYASWCGPCKRMAPELEKLAREYKGKLIVAKVDVDRSPLVSRQKNIQRIPTLVLFQEGREIRREEGAKTLEQLRQFIKPALKN